MERPHSCFLSLIESISQREQQVCDAKCVLLQRISVTSVMSSSLSAVSPITEICCWKHLSWLNKAHKDQSSDSHIHSSGGTWHLRHSDGSLCMGTLAMLQLAEQESLFTMKSSGPSWPPVSMLTEAFILALGAQLCSWPTADPPGKYLYPFTKTDSTSLDLNVRSLSFKPFQTGESIF